VYSAPKGVRESCCPFTIRYEGPLFFPSFLSFAPSIHEGILPLLNRSAQDARRHPRAAQTEVVGAKGELVALPGGLTVTPTPTTKGLACFPRLRCPRLLPRQGVLGNRLVLLAVVDSVPLVCLRRRAREGSAWRFRSLFLSPTRRLSPRPRANSRRGPRVSLRRSPTPPPAPAAPHGPSGSLRAPRPAPGPPR
jgi:hypothetical protein